MVGPRLRPHRTDAMLMRFADTGIVAELPGDEPFQAALAKGAFDWPRIAETHGVVVSRVEHRGDHYVLHSPGLDPLRASAVEAVCGLMVDVVDALIAKDDRALWLHCGAVEFAGRLVLFPSASRAGKSTLVCALAACGHRVYGDDILRLCEDDRSGQALGIAPRLRLPLPSAAPSTFRRFVERHTGISDGRYLYLDRSCGRLAERGRACPIGAVVLLERAEDGPAHLTSAGESHALQALVAQNFGTAPAPSSLERLHALVGTFPCLRLTYADLGEATGLLERAFSAWPPSIGTGAPTPVPKPPQPKGRNSGGLPDARKSFRRREGIELRHVEDDAFLADGDGQSIFHLNALGRAVWALLDEGISAGETADLLCEMFPGMEQTRVRSDVAVLFSDLLAEDLIRPAQGHPTGSGTPDRRPSPAG